MKDITKSRRYFHIGEIVFNCDTREMDNFDFGVITLINGKAEDGLVDEDTIVTLSMRHNDYEGDNECYATNCYKICKKWTRLTGEVVCFEHQNFKDSGGCKYPYYEDCRKTALQCTNRTDFYDSAAGKPTSLDVG